MKSSNIKAKMTYRLKDLNKPNIKIPKVISFLSFQLLVSSQLPAFFTFSTWFTFSFIPQV
jgi:hypothetical protein